MHRCLISDVVLPPYTREVVTVTVTFLLAVAIRYCALFTRFQILHKISKSCMKFGHLILRKIIKFVATRCEILRLKCTKFNFGWGSAPDPAGGAYSAPPDPLAGFKGAYF